jgi:hypothetical protein
MNDAASLTQVISAATSGVVQALTLLEGATYRSQATAALKVASQYIGEAAATLERSQFSQSALERFGGRVMNALKNTAQELLEMGWRAGRGKGAAPPAIVKEYLDLQLGFLATWITDIEAAGKLVGGAYRAQMYAQSLETVYQRAYMAAKGQAVGWPDLPAYPRDGSTQCHTNCQCSWRIERKSEQEYHATWTLHPADHCDDCVGRAKNWNPLRIVLQEDGSWKFIAKNGPLP